MLWQSRHGWPQLQMGQVVADEVALGGGRLSTAIGLVISAGSLVGIVLSGYGLWRLLRAAQLRPYRFLGVTVLGMAVAIVALPGRSYYAMGLYPVLYAVATVQLQQHRPAIWWRWVPTWPVYAVSAVISVAALVGPRYGLPLAYSGYRGYGYFDPPPDRLDAVLYVGDDPGVLRPHCAAELREVTPAQPGFDSKLWWCPHLRTPWHTLWPQLQHMQ